MKKVTRIGLIICSVCLCIAAIILTSTGTQVSAEYSGTNLESVDTSRVSVISYVTADADFLKEIKDNYSKYDSEKNALRINSAAQLAAFRDAVNLFNYDFDDRFVVLTDNIDLNGTLPTVVRGTPAGNNKLNITISGRLSNVWEPIGNEYTSFKGTFNGNSYIVDKMVVCIKNTSVKVHSSEIFEYDSAGFFGSISGTALIKGLGIGENSKIVYTSTSNNKPSYVGGICGTGSVGSNILNSYNKAAIYCNVTKNNVNISVGGIVGCDSSINSCYNTGDIFVASLKSSAAGISAYGSTIRNCYNTGDIFNSATSGSANEGVAGIITYAGEATNCYNVGSVSSRNNVDPVILKGTITNCYYDKSVVIIMASSKTLYNGIPLTTPQMQGEAAKTNMPTFASEKGDTGYNIWTFIEGKYPQLTPIPKNEKIIKTFTIADQVGSTIIDESNYTVSLTMPYGTDLSSLVPTITVSDDATVSPNSGVAQNFTNPVKYTVTAKFSAAPDNSKQDYMVTVICAKNPAKQITDFRIIDQIGSSVIDQVDHTINVLMPYGTSLLSLTPTIGISAGATVSPNSRVAQDFTSPVTYTVTAEDGSTQNYIVTVTCEKNTAKQITGFTITNQVGTSVINQTNHTISVTMPYGTSLVSLTPTITISNDATVSPNSGVSQDFRNSVTYTVTAEDGTTQEYIVTVTCEKNTEKQIIGFIITNQVGSTVIDESNHTISITMLYGTDLSGLIPTITISDDATVSPNSGVAQDFRNSVTYTVTAEDNTTQEYIVTVTCEKNTEKQIIEFTIANQVGSSIIDQVNHTISVIMPYGTSLLSLRPTIEVSLGATVNPKSGVVQDFSFPLFYTVTAENGNIQGYIVTVTCAKNPAKQITEFTITNQVGSTIIDQVNHTINVTMPYGTVLSGLVPTITISDDAAINPNSGVSQNFTNAVTYTVTAEDGTTQEYIVTVTCEKNTAKQITGFTITNQVGSTVIDQINHTITILMPYGTDLSGLVPIIVISGDATVSPISGVSQDFTNMVTYTVTAEDGTTQEYIVTVTCAKNPAKEITEFIITNQVGTSVINQTNHTISVIMPYGTSLVSLTPTITISDDATVSPNSGVSQDFRNSVTYTVMAEDGNTQNYIVTVTCAKNTEKIITGFEITGQVGTSVINEINHTISVIMPYGTDLSSLIPTIVISDDATVSPNSGVAQDFTNPVTYTVTAENGDTQDYTITVTCEKNSDKRITEFVIDRQVSAVINEDKHTITVIMPSGTNRTNLIPIFSISSDATVSPNSGVAQNFTNPVKYTVTAEDGSTQEYIVTVIVQSAPYQPTYSSQKEILTFTIAGQISSVIDTKNFTISVLMPNGTNLNNLTPSITISNNAKINPISGEQRNFNNAVIYTVTAENGSTQNYSVTVTTQLSSLKAITQFTIPSQVSSVINEQNHTITVLMPYGTNLTNITPTITISSNATINPSSGSPKNFTSVVTYTVTAQDGSIANYNVTVTCQAYVPALSSEKEIKQVSIPNQCSISIIEQNIYIVMPFGTDLRNLIINFTISEGATISPSIDLPQDFTNPITYTVTAQDGSIIKYIATVSVEDEIIPPDDNGPLGWIIAVVVVSTAIAGTIIYFFVIKRRKRKE